MNWPKTRLSITSFDTAQVAIDLFFERQARLLIFSTAYRELWKQEAKLKYAMARLKGVPEDRIKFIKGIETTYQEVAQGAQILEEAKIYSLTLVADRWHTKRTLAPLQEAMPRVKIYPFSVKCRYEIAREPSIIKSLRISQETSWALWNLLFLKLYPMFRSQTQKR